MNLREFINECQKRTIFRTLSIYAVSSWLIIQIAATTFPFLGLPKLAVTVVIIGVLLGLPFIMGFSWYYSVRTGGDGNIVLEQDQDNPEDAKHIAFRKVYFSITALISIGVLFIVISLIRQYISANDQVEIQPVSIPIEEGRITIEAFENKTGDATLDVIGEMAADRIEHSITQNNLSTVVSNSAFKEYEEIFLSGQAEGKTLPSVYAYLSIYTKIVGNYYLDGDNLLFDCSIIDPKNGEVKDALETIRTPRANPLVAIDKIKEIILGYLATKSAAPKLFIETHTPKFEAYKSLLLRNEDMENELSYLEQAIALDPDYFEPKLLRLSYYYNEEKFETVDSLYVLLKQQSLQADDRQKNLLSFYNALLEGNNRLAYNYHLKEYEIAPFHLPSNSTMMVLALQYVNRPDMVIKFYNDIPQKGLDIESCYRCHTRVYVYCMSLMQLGDYDKVVEELTSLIRISDKIWYNTLLVKALVRLGDWRGIESLIRSKVELDTEDLVSLYMTAGREAILTGDSKRADEYFTKVIDMQVENAGSLENAEARYFLGDYKASYEMFESLMTEGSTNINVLSWLAMASVRTGEITRSEEILAEMNTRRNEYDFGSIDYNIAKYYIAMGEEETALSFLRKAIASGARYESQLFTNDPTLKSIIKTPQFEEVMKYWY